MIKPHIVSDKNNLSLKIKKSLESKNDFYSLSKSNLIIVIGGDGFMLQTLHNTQDLSAPVYGMNRGTVGFLMGVIFNIGSTYPSGSHDDPGSWHILGFRH